MLLIRPRAGARAASGGSSGASPLAATHPAYRLAPLRAACVGPGPCQRRSRTRQHAGCLFFYRSSRFSRRNPDCVRDGNSLSLSFPWIDPCSVDREVMLAGHFARRTVHDASGAHRPRRPFGGEVTTRCGMLEPARQLSWFVLRATGWAALPRRPVPCSSGATPSRGARPWASRTIRTWRARRERIHGA